MSPEAPGNLAVLDLYADPGTAQAGTPRLRCQVERYDPIEAGQISTIYVSWFADEAGEGFMPLADGVVYVEPRRDYKHGPTYDAPVQRAGGRYFWTHPVHPPALMLVAILPRGRVVATRADTDPNPTGVKSFDGRMALSWLIGGPDHADVAWRLTEIEPPEIDARCEGLLEEIRVPARPRTHEV
jgi:hypothetical protein